MQYINRIFFCILLLISGFVQAAPVSSEFQKANQYYRSGDYEHAISTYENLLKQGYSSAALYYNLGNAYYKQENVARAIINYERALKLTPQDEDILFNLRLANLNTVDKIEPLPQLFYEQWWEKFISLYSSDTWSLFGIAALWITFGFAVLFIFARRIWLKKTGFYSATFFLIAGILLLMAGRVQHKHMYSQQAAVVTETSAYVKSSPDEKSTNLFMLHAGTKIDIVDELQGWKKIKIANGNEGWINSQQLEVI
jgi:tetratricopeptide (TPR) repeat protein